MPFATQQYLLLSHPELSRKRLQPVHGSVGPGSFVVMAEPADAHGGVFAQRGHSAQ